MRVENTSVALHKETNVHYSIPISAVAHSITKVQMKRERIKLIKTLNNLRSVHFTYKHILPTNAHKTCILLKFKIKFGVCYHTILRGDVCCFQLQLKLALQFYRKLSFCSCTLLSYRPLVALLSYSMEQSPS